MKTQSNLIAIFSLLVVPILAFLLFLLGQLEYFKVGTTFKENYENCRYLDTKMYGTEDITKYNSTTLLYSSGDLLKLYLVGEPLDVEPGSIYAIYNAQQKNFKIEKLYLHDMPMNIVFQPHGIYVKSFEDGNYLYAINHAFERISERLECFKIVDVQGKLQLDYQYSVYFPDEYNGVLNDLIVLSKSHFLITQFLPVPVAKKGYGIMFKSRVKYTSLSTKLNILYSAATKQKETYVLSCKINSEYQIHVHLPKCVKIGSTEGVENTGIAYDSKYVYVLDSIEKLVRKFKFIPEEEGLLEQIDSLKLDGTPDNIEYDPETNKLYIAVIYKMWDMLMLSRELMRTQQVVDKIQDMWSASYEIDLNRDAFNYTVVHMEKNISGCSSATYQMGQNLFIGGPGDSQLVVCDKIKK